MIFEFGLLDALLSTVLDVAPIAGILVVFQMAVLRRRLPNPGRMAVGFVMVLFGLALFLVGLEKALFPIGQTMAQQLTAPGTIGQQDLSGGVDWRDYGLVYAFAAAIGFATTIAEPSLIAVALKAEDVSGGAVRAVGLRIAVAVGVARRRGPGLLPHSHRDAPAPVYHRRLHYRHRADLPFQQDHRAPGLRQRRGDHLDGYGARGGRAGIGPRRQHSGPQPVDRRLRSHCLCQRIPHHVGAGLRHRGVLVERAARPAPR